MSSTVFIMNNQLADRIDLWFVSMLSQYFLFQLSLFVFQLLMLRIEKFVSLYFFI